MQQVETLSGGRDSQRGHSRALVEVATADAADVDQIATVRVELVAEAIGQGGLHCQQ
jgi:hypothetical protein